MITLYRYVKRKRAEKRGDQVKPEPGPEPKQSRPGVWRWRLTMAAALAIPVYLETLDYTVVATAQTHIASLFNRLDIQSWIGTSYLLTSTVFLPFFASVADIYGRHSALQLSLFLFILGSAISTGAQNMEMMIGGRSVSGIGAAGLLTVVRTIMADSSSLDDNNWQIAMMFILYTLGYSTGPAIGGALLAAASFRWIFAINLPTSALAMVLAFFLLRGKIKKGQPASRLPENAKQAPETYISKLLRIDWVGTALFVAGGILVLLGLNWGSTQEWKTARVIVSFVIGGLCFIACLGWEYLLERQETSPNPSSWRVLWAEPMIPLETLGSYDVLVVQFGSYVGGMVMLVMFYFVAIFMTIVTELPPEKAGVQLIYFAPGMGGGTLVSVQMIKYLRQPKYPIILGSAIIPVSLGLISMAMEQNKQGAVNGYMVMAGVGCGLTAGSLIVHARFSLSDKRAAIVSALTLFFRSFGGTVGLAQCATVLNAKVRSQIIAAATSGALSLEDAQAIAASSQAISSLQSIDQLPPEVRAIVKDAFKEGTRWAFISLIPWAGLGAFLSLFLSNIPDSARKKSEVTTPDSGVTTPDDGKQTMHSERVDT